MTGQERAFNSWLSMMRRCFLSSDSSYKNYGGRGVTVCERWYDWRKFLADMGDRPEDRSLDRIDTDGSYEPANCRWADSVTQNRNTRANVHVEVDGVSMLACDAARLLGVTPASVSRRGRAGKPLNERQPLKLLASEVKQIKQRLAAGENCTSIGSAYGVTRQHVSAIRDGKVWRSLV